MLQLYSVYTKAFYLSELCIYTVQRLCAQITKPLSVQLQGTNQDIHRAVTSVQDCVAVMQQIRDNGTYTRIFETAAALYGEDVQMPRLAARQQHRTNVPASTADEYYRLAVYLPFVDCCIQQLNERFSQHAVTACQLTALLPAYCTTTDFSVVEPAGALYAKFLPGKNVTTLQMEFLRWQQYWKRQAQDVARPQSATEALHAASELGTYPAICVLLKIYATLPVTTATGERSFSALKYLKNYLRSTMTEDRLNGLAHLYINRDVPLDYSKVIEEFARHNRRLSFV